MAASDKRNAKLSWAELQIQENRNIMEIRKLRVFIESSVTAWIISPKVIFSLASFTLFYLYTPTMQIISSKVILSHGIINFFPLYTKFLQSFWIHLEMKFIKFASWVETINYIILKARSGDAGYIDPREGIRAEAWVFFTNAVSTRYGLEGDWGINLGWDYYQDNTANITRNSFTGLSYDVDGGYGFGVNIWGGVW